MEGPLAELVARTPSQSGPPDLSVVSPLAYSGLGASWELSRDGTLDLSLTPDVLDSAAIDRLADPRRFPCEVRVRRDRGDPILWQGPVWNVQGQGGSVTVKCRGLLAYTRGMIIGPDTGDLTFTGEDQNAIVAGLIDAWQNLDWGDFGIDTSQVGTTGVTRDRTYVAAEQPDMHSRIANLADLDDGPDVEIDPDSRELHCRLPQGSDLTDSVFLDGRNVASADEQRSVADGDVATVVYGHSQPRREDGATEDPPPLSATAEAATEMAEFGRWAYAESHDGVSEQATLDSHTQAALDARRRLLWQPGTDVIPVPEAELGQLWPGNSVRYSFDGLLGRTSHDVRIVRLSWSVSSSGSESLQVQVEVVS